MIRVFGLIFRYLALVLLVAAFAVAAPLWGLFNKLIIGLTSEEPYVRVIRDLGLGELAGGLLEIRNLLPERIIGYLEQEQSAAGEGGDHLSQLQQELSRAVDEAAVRVAAQVPAYVAGRRDRLEGAVELGQFRSQALNVAVEVAPGGKWLESWIRKGVESAIPERVSLDPALSKLELVLKPLRIAVKSLLSAINWLRDLAVLLLGLIAVLAFRLSRAVRWAGIALVAAGLVGSLLGGLLSLVLGLVIPDTVLESQLFQELLTSSVTGFRGSALTWLSVGAGLIALSIALPPVLRLIGRRWRSCPISALLRFLVPRTGSNIATLLAALPAHIGYLATGGPRLRRGARAALGGRVAASVLFDCALPVALLTLIAGDGVLGTFGWLAVSALIVPFWAFRDQPARLSGFNFIDRLAGVRQGRQPTKRAKAASILRALPLIGALAAAAIVHPVVPFVVVAAAEITVLMFVWPDRTIGSLLAGTRARLHRSHQ